MRNRQEIKMDLNDCLGFDNLIANGKKEQIRMEVLLDIRMLLNVLLLKVSEFIEKGEENND